MSKTYEHIPISVADIFSDIVGTVSDNLAGESSLDISQVSFKCETWLELIARLTRESQVASYDDVRYPLVALIRNWDERSNENNGYVSISVNLVIVTPSRQEWLSQEREDNNYIPVLRPIYSEFMQCIKSSRCFANYFESLPTHVKTESFLLGREGNKGNTAYSLPDIVDGIIITGLELLVVPTRDSLPIYGPDVLLSYLNNVSELSITGVNSNTMRVTLTSAGYTDEDGIGYGASPEYSIYTGHDHVTQSITVGQTVIYPLTINDNHVHTGCVICDDGYAVSKLYFMYWLSNGVIRHLQSKAKFELTNFELSTTTYDVYPFDINLRTISDLKAISYQNITIDGGNEMWSETYSTITEDTGADTIGITEPLTSELREVVNAVTIGDEEFENKSFYKIIIT